MFSRRRSSAIIDVDTEEFVGQGPEQPQLQAAPPAPAAATASAAAAADSDGASSSAAAESPAAAAVGGSPVPSGATATTAIPTTRSAIAASVAAIVARAEAVTESRRPTRTLSQTSYISIDPTLDELAYDDEDLSSPQPYAAGEYVTLASEYDAVSPPSPTLGNAAGEYDNVGPLASPLDESYIDDDLASIAAMSAAGQMQSPVPDKSTATSPLPSPPALPLGQSPIGAGRVSAQSADSATDAAESLESPTVVPEVAGAAGKIDSVASATGESTTTVVAEASAAEVTPAPASDSISRLPSLLVSSMDGPDAVAIEVSGATSEKAEERGSKKKDGRARGQDEEDSEDDSEESDDDEDEDDDDEDGDDDEDEDEDEDDEDDRNESKVEAEEGKVRHRSPSKGRSTSRPRSSVGGMLAHFLGFGEDNELESWEEFYQTRDLVVDEDKQEQDSQMSRSPMRSSFGRPSPRRSSVRRLSRQLGGQDSSVSIQVTAADAEESPGRLAVPTATRRRSSLSPRRFSAASPVYETIEELHGEGSKRASVHREEGEEDDDAPPVPRRGSSMTPLSTLVRGVVMDGLGSFRNKHRSSTSTKGSQDDAMEMASIGSGPKAKRRSSAAKHQRSSAEWFGTSGDYVHDPTQGQASRRVSTASAKQTGAKQALPEAGPKRKSSTDSAVAAEEKDARAAPRLSEISEEARSKRASSESQREPHAHKAKKGKAAKMELSAEPSAAGQQQQQQQQQQDQQEKKKKKKKKAKKGGAGTKRGRSAVDPAGIKRKPKPKGIREHRPFFTYYVTVCQVAVMILALVVYGVAPINLTASEESRVVDGPDGSTTEASYNKESNFWIGPSPDAIIAMGAKYAPCMRRDKRVWDSVIKPQEEAETEYGCCSDQGTTTGNCYTTTAAECQGFKTFTPGKICGGQQCCSNATQSKYPNCSPVSAADSSDPTCTCTVTARPCCIGLLGGCQIVSEQYCDFVEGHFHPDAELCSQVNCLEDTCGLGSFVNSSVPDQWYRLILALFLHMGAIHLLVVLLLQQAVLSDFERLAGWLRVGLIFLISGMGGYLLALIVTPYQVSTGASPALFGLLGCLYVELVQSWRYFRSPAVELLKLLVLTLLAFGVGLLPYIDNWSHAGALVLGIVCAMAFLPYITCGRWNRAFKRMLVLICLPLVLGIVAALGLLVHFDVLECSWCHYFNCIDFTKDLCTDNLQNLAQLLS